MTDQEKIKLLPCPFCGSEHAHAEQLPDSAWWAVHCPGNNCPTSGCWVVKAETKSEAITDWNKRAVPIQPEQPVDERAEFEKKLTGIYEPYELLLNEYGDYKSTSLCDLWIGWLSRAALNGGKS
jgi:hypothetical protein